MSVELVKLVTEKLLEKFGSGNHKPGSGSAAAFQGMISAKLLVTVISLTNKKKRRKEYSIHLPELLKMQSKINTRIFPYLTRLFQEDSIQFDKTIKLRKKRNKEGNPIIRNELSKQALTELKIAIDIPIEIAKLSVELCEIGAFVFDNAFQSARGDSQVALSGSLSALSGCLSIIQLNLLSLGSDELEWIEKTITVTNKLKLKHNNLNALTISKVDILEKEAQNHLQLFKEVNQILKKYQSKEYLTDKEIETCASALQNSIWSNRTAIWEKDIPSHPKDTLKPKVVFRKALAYNCYTTKEIDTNIDNGDFKVAGIIDQEKKLVLIADEYTIQTQNFTAAHELGHAILHKQTIMHRDRPIDGSSIRGTRNIQEYQADKFATYFLMPKRQVETIFTELFLTDKFIINENSAFNLERKSPSELKTKTKNLRGLSRKLASSESYNNEYFISLSELFNVSVETMAIRLEELNLLEF